MSSVLLKKKLSTKYDKYQYVFTSGKIIINNRVIIFWVCKYKKVHYNMITFLISITKTVVNKHLIL